MSLIPKRPVEELTDEQKKILLEAFSIIDETGKWKPEFLPDELAAIVQLEARLKWALEDSYEITGNITRNANGVIESADVRWPDGETGAFTATQISEEFAAIDAYEITHPTSGKKVVQAAVTRDADGNVTEKPALTLEDI